MSRFRLRFLLQEFDLPEGEVFIGRSPECQISIEDALISRKHAKLLVSADAALFVDLGSRNGSRVNGKFVQAPLALNDSDRLRLGGQELVFFELGRERRAARATSAMIHCRRCNSPFAEGALACPHCGEAVEAAREEETVSGLVLETRRGWVLQLVGEVLERALAARKTSEADRVLRRAVDEFNEQRLADGVEVGRDLAQLSEWCVRLVELSGSPQWLHWIADTYRSTQLAPPVRLLKLLSTVVEVPGAPLALRGLAAYCRSGVALTAEESASLAFLEQQCDGRS